MSRVSVFFMSRVMHASVIKTSRVMRDISSRIVGSNGFIH